ncbi:MAG: LysR family transcriptional regulator [Sandaracinaceae bacterium]|jgi:DNA-binding transcriptional LysR family regulator|nr:LysR family transcriptional regulator [Sandaracinaceae bacterium]MBK8592288.1 LysR family transcriptional regulator [Sandaracinaceae bacterium]MBP7680351.1 LysR family transcriptional regulator [Deltaproteobacteria bacterium]
MLDWDDVRYLLAVKRKGTLAAAAPLLRTNATTVGRRITQLEERLSVRLFDRTSSGWTPTEACKRLLPHAERMELEALALERVSAASDTNLSGPVHLTTTEIVAARYLAPHLPRLRLLHPGIELVISCVERRLRLGRREADIALRIMRPTELDLVARCVMRVDLALHAAPEYLERRGRPSAPSSFVDHDLVAFMEGPGSELENAWLAENCPGARVVLRTNSVATVVEAVREGLGLGLAPRRIGDRDPRLVRLDTPRPPTPREVWLAYHQDIEPSPRVRAVIDFLVETLSE